jgi:hypothetical protein
MKLVENDGMSDSPQDSPNVVYIIISRNETFGYDTHLNFLVLQRQSLKRSSDSLCYTIKKAWNADIAIQARIKRPAHIIS